MTDTVAATNLTPKQWDAKFFTEYVQANRFKRYFGKSENSMIQVKMDLTKKKGDAIHYALVNRLDATRNDGTSRLEGSEDQLFSRAHRLTVDLLRNAVTMNEFDEQKSAIDLRMAAKSALKVWAMEELRNDVIAGLSEIRTAIGTKVAYGSASAGQRNTWLDNNIDRLVFGEQTATASDFAASLTSIVVGDKLDAAHLSKVKRKALTASPKIKPITVNGDEQWYVYFAHPYSMRDLKLDTTFNEANKDARARGKSNPLFRDADYIYDGLIIREIADAEWLEDVGAGGTVDVAVNHLCGAQAMGVGWAKTTSSRTQDDDYGNENGVGIVEIRGVDKLCFEKGAADSDEWVQNGCITDYVAAAAD